MYQQGTMREKSRQTHEQAGSRDELRLVVMYYMIPKYAIRDISEEP
jgi:hypothetical protein